MQITSNADEFKRDITNILLLAKANVREVADRTVMSLFTQIVMKSPVDTGNFRANWNFSFGSPDFSTRDAAGAGEAGGAEVVGKMKSDIASAQDGVLGKTSCLANGLPYGPILEYGGYPNPPKKGSYVKGSGYVIKSVGGFSRQAPQGMVRVTLVAFDEVLRVAAEEVRWRKWAGGFGWSV